MRAPCAEVAQPGRAPDHVGEAEDRVDYAARSVGLIADSNPALGTNPLSWICTASPDFKLSIFQVFLSFSNVLEKRVIGLLGKSQAYSQVESFRDRLCKY